MDIRPVAPLSQSRPGLDRSVSGQDAKTMSAIDLKEFTQSGNLLFQEFDGPTKQRGFWKLGTKLGTHHSAGALETEESKAFTATEDGSYRSAGQTVTGPSRPFSTTGNSDPDLSTPIHVKNRVSFRDHRKTSKSEGEHRNDVSFRCGTWNRFLLSVHSPIFEILLAASASVRWPHPWGFRFRDAGVEVNAPFLKLGTSARFRFGLKGS